MRELVDYFLKGGILMWPILAMSILSWAIILERAWNLRRGRMIDDKLVDAVRKSFESGDADGAEKMLDANSKMVASVIGSGLDEYRHTKADVETAMQASAERGLRVLWNNMLALNTIGRVATLLGLLGTVVGMVKGFEELSQAGVAKEKLAEAIGIALMTTVAGLSVAIPAIIAESAFKSKIRKLMIEFEDIMTEMVKAVRVGGVK